MEWTFKELTSYVCEHWAYSTWSNLAAVSERVELAGEIIIVLGRDLPPLMANRFVGNWTQEPTDGTPAQHITLQYLKAFCDCRHLYHSPHAFRPHLEVPVVGADRVAEGAELERQYLATRPLRLPVVVVVQVVARSHSAPHGT